MSFESRLARLEAEHNPPSWRAPLHVIAKVEAIIRCYLRARGDTRVIPDPPAVTARISFSVRTALAIMAVEGVAAGWRWAEGLQEELVPGVLLVVRRPAADAERAAFERGDLTPETWDRQFPEHMRGRFP
jgi:hypothetical protein